MSHEQKPGENSSEKPTSGFRIRETEGEDGAYREISVEGELDLAVAGQLQDAIARSDGELTLINLEACDFIDSTGIAVIVLAHRGKGKKGSRLVVHSPTDRVLRVLAVTGLLDDGLVFEGREAALGTSDQTG
jgi:anti-anti-sigma factor